MPSVAQDERSAAAIAAARRLRSNLEGLPALDRLAALAARLLASQSAQVSLLTDAQTIAGGANLPAGTSRADSPLGDSLCTVTASSGVPLVVDDAAADARVAGLAPVRSGAVGSYLGVPLLASGGRAVGALCVYNDAPHGWDPEDVALLGQLAAWASAELELNVLTEESATSQARWELAFRAAGIGGFDWDLRTGRLTWDERLLEMFGLDRETFDETIEGFSARVHRDDRDRVAEALAAAIAAVGAYEAEYRVVQPSGAVRWIRARGRALSDESGVAVRVLGAALDTTAEREGETRLVRVLESMSAAFVAMDRDWRINYANREAEHLTGMARSDLIGGVMWELFPATVGTAFETSYRRAAETGVPEVLEAYYPAPLDAWFEVRVWPAADGVSLYFLDVTARRAAQALFELSARAGETLSDSLDAEASVRELAELVVPILADWSIVTVADPDGTSRDLATWHADPAQRPLVERFAATRRGGAAADAAVAAPGGGEPVEIALSVGRRTVGTLTLGREAERPALSDDQRAVAVSIADRAAMALDNARLVAEERAAAARLHRANRRLHAVAEHERTVARALQDAMLTRLPESDDLQLVARYLTASGNDKVGGDWYDAVVLPGGATALVIGDVVGHDIDAAALMGQLRNMLRVLAWDRDEAPAKLVARLDRAMRDLRLRTFATLALLRVEQGAPGLREGARTLRWTNAGHPAPVLVHADGTALLLEGPTDVLLGVVPETVRRDHTHRAPHDSTLLLYTDGLVETPGESIDVGQRRLLDALATHAGLALEPLLDTVLRDLVGDHPTDDVAILAVRFEPDEPKDD